MLWAFISLTFAGTSAIAHPSGDPVISALNAFKTPPRWSCRASTSMVPGRSYTWTCIEGDWLCTVEWSKEDFKLKPTLLQAVFTNPTGPYRKLQKTLYYTNPKWNEVVMDTDELPLRFIEHFQNFCLLPEDKLPSPNPP